MTERPILFSGAMVRAILAGTKTQTRRPVKLEKAGCGEGLICRDGHYIEMSADGPVWMPHGGSGRVPCPPDVVQKYCPFGKPGDQLWVRETWQTRDDEGYYTRADMTFHRTADPRCREIWERHQPPGAWPEWIPSIHMPRWASRITLEITDVRVQRVQEISGPDATAEGVCENADCKYVNPAHIEMFRQLWDATYAKQGYCWQANPWTWAISFRRVEARG